MILSVHEPEQNRSTPTGNAKSVVSLLTDEVIIAAGILSLRTCKTYRFSNQHAAVGQTDSKQYLDVCRCNYFTVTGNFRRTNATKVGQ